MPYDLGWGVVCTRTTGTESFRRGDGLVLVAKGLEATNVLGNVMRLRSMTNKMSI